MLNGKDTYAGCPKVYVRIIMCCYKQRTEKLDNVKKRTMSLAKVSNSDMLVNSCMLLREWTS